jgi:hypothetical protein
MTPQEFDLFKKAFNKGYLFMKYDKKTYQRILNGIKSDNPIKHGFKSGGDCRLQQIQQENNKNIPSKNHQKNRDKGFDEL